MTLLEMKDIARKAFEKGWNEGDLNVLKEVHTPYCVLEDPNFPIEGKGPDAIVSFAKAIRTAFPDVNFKIEDQVAEGDKVVNFMRITGTQEGEFLGVPPTHKKATVTCFVLMRFEGSKVAHVINLWDALGFMRSAGVLEKIKEATYALR